MFTGRRIWAYVLAALGSGGLVLSLWTPTTSLDDLVLTTLATPGLGGCLFGPVDSYHDNRRSLPQRDRSPPMYAL